MIILNSPIKRIGGKKLLRKIITERIPKHVCYVEPFFGAGWIYFYKEHSKIEVINDIDDEIVNLFDVIKNKQDEFLDGLRFNLYSRTVFNKYKNAEVSGLSDVQRAIRFWYLIQYSFGAKCDTYGYMVNKSGNPNLLNMIDRIKQSHMRLQNTNIENKSFEDIIPRYDREHTFFYCDPPYFCKTGYGYKFGYNEHVVLAELLDSIKGKFLLSVNSCDEAFDIYGKFNVEVIDNTWSIQKERKVKVSELLVSNY